MEKTIFLFVTMLLTALNVSLGQKAPNAAISKEDSLHIKNIETNLKPVFVLKGKTYEKTISGMMKDNNIPGVSIAFVDKGTIAWTKCYGYSDLEQSAKVSNETVFLSASLSKPVTAMAALHLVEAGILNLDEDVNNKLKAWKIPVNEYTQKQKVTLRRLLGHTAGLIEKDRIFLGYGIDEKVPTVEQILRGEKPSKDSTVYVEFEPGLRRRYSNAGYLVIQQLMTDATGKSFPGLIDDIVLKPCLMTESSIEQPIPEELMRKKAIGYSKRGDSYKYNIYPFMAPAALWTTPIDLGKFMITLIKNYESRTPTILSQEMIQKVLSRTEQDLGFSKIHYDKDLFFRHTGSNDGFTCYMVSSIDKKQALIIMTNSDNGFNLIEATQRAVAQEYNWEYFKPQVVTEFAIEKNKLDDYGGRFEMSADTLQFKIEKDRLLVQSAKTGNTPQEVIAIKENSFLLPSIPMKFTFLKDNTGLVNKVEITNEHADTSIAMRSKK